MRDKKRVLSAVRRLKYPVTISKIRERTGFTEFIVRKNLNSLSDEGLVTLRKVGGVWFIDLI